MVDSINKITKRADKLRRDRDWVKFHSLRNLAVALNKEAAELLEKFQWNDDGSLTEKETKELYDELADIFINTLFLSMELNIDLLKITNEKITKIDKKYPVDKVRGISGRDMHEAGKITKKINL